ncbi:MAG: ABC transporter ATP-binding protein [Melioribacter sp.]|uniref:ABC transporter ATP-binding protein n=1 Tax=Rosettibacter primus TaxID=3111523 RepID=UPI00247DE854|nr:ABC transporter ATP-binding protein [Melioribacter sp.]
MLLFGAIWIISGNLLLGEMMAAYSLTIGALPSINGLINANISLQSANIAVTRLMDMLLIEREKSESTRKFQLKNKIKIENAKFSWDGRNYLFENINLEIPVGRITSLWGPSGSGKSTLVQLLQRKYLLNNGKILLDEINANEFDLIDYRNNIGVVPQEIKIFNGTLADNILVGRTIQNYNFLIDVIDELNLSSFLKRFNYGLYTMLGENGRKLSGGEMQMLALIRALLFKPRVLIIDEGLSGIDFELEELIFNTIRSYSENNAVFLITHNISNLMRTDYLYVIRDGRIEEYKSPDLLIKNGNSFGINLKNYYYFENANKTDE